MAKTSQTPAPEHIDRLILRFSDGQITREELAILEEWIRESEDNLRYYRQFRNMLDNSMPMNINSGLALEKVLGRISPEGKRRTIFFHLQRIAAVLTIPLVLALFLLLMLQHRADRKAEETFTTTTAAFGSVSAFELQDGSRVWLNSGSSLQVPQKFGDIRQVRLTGEAYFEVRSDPSAPFVVSTGGFSVKATGTVFHVMAYAGQRPCVSLAEGKVTVKIGEAAGNGKEMVMYPGQHLSLTEDMAEYSLERGDVYKYYSWKDGRLIFRNDMLADIMQRISLQYNVDIEITDHAIMKNRYRATFDEETLTEVLDLLKLASPFEYREVVPVGQPDGSFTKRKIIISSSHTSGK